MTDRAVIELGSDVRIRLLRAPVGSGFDHFVGGVLDHPNPSKPSGRCGGAIYWEGPRAAWTLVSLEPLDIGGANGHDGALVCHCGRRGFVREGRWVDAA